jgi:hypothetical protein
VGGEGDTSDMDVDEVVKAKAQESGDDDHSNQKSSANDSVDAYCWSKVVSDGQVDLSGLLVPMKFGEWNPRPLHQKDNELAHSVFMSAVETFRPGTLIAKECLTDGMTSTAAKPLQPSEMGDDMSALIVSGGRHRYDVNSKFHACICSTSTTYLVQADRDPAANLSRQSTDAVLEDDDSDMPVLMQVTEDTDDEDLIE